jgi:YVTN family beta-propeller protein
LKPEPCSPLPARLWFGLCLGLILPGTLTAREARDLPGLRADGSVLLPNQWSLRPVGRQLPLGDFPVNVAVHPGGTFAAILHCGHGQHEVVVVDLERLQVVSRVSLEEGFYGLAFDATGDRLFCSGSGDEVVHGFAFKDGYLGEHRLLRVRPVTQRGVPGGIAVAPDGSRLWTANVWGHSVSEVTLATPTTSREISLGVPALAAGTLVPPPADPDLAAATKRDEAGLAPNASTDAYPYACVLDPPRQRLYVSLWAKSQVAVIDLESRAVTAVWPTQEHPNELVLAPDGARLFVANANRNTVTVLDAATGRPLETLSAALHPHSPPGSTPNSLALSPDGRRLFVANACNNNVAVFDVSQPGASRSLGFIPVGWYPTSVRVTPDGKRLLVANGKGLLPKSNRHGPQPGPTDPPATIREYIGGLFKGTLSVIDLPTGEGFEVALKAWTVRAYACSPLQPAAAVSAAAPAGSPVPAKVGDPSPIKYCLYILKENRTYDQVLGDLPQGNGDPSLCLFPEAVTPNHHALAREFVLLDNFYVESEVSADGHEWSMGAYATDFVEKSWPLSYGHNARGKIPYPSEGKFAVAMPASGYLWDRAREAGVTYRSYGEFAENGRTPADPATTRVASLIGHIDPGFRAWDMDYPDVQRAERFISELKRFEAEGDMPRLQIMRLPNDHTYGTAAGKLTPRAMVADNDLAFGMVVEAVSKSKFWPQTAIFVVEDDAQNGPDHVDAHRTIAYVISPYVRRGGVDSTMYSTCSLLRTMELILGMQPMTQFDAAARPMYASFQAQPDLRPYTAKPVTADRNERNTRLAWGSDLSETMDFSKEDAADDLLLNEVIWRSVKGPDSPMPAPVRAAFVFQIDEDEDDGEIASDAP